MKNTVRYVLTYRKLEELITVDHFTSVYDALAYCKNEGIDDPMELVRVETVEERVFTRAQLHEVLNRDE